MCRVGPRRRVTVEPRKSREADWRSEAGLMKMLHEKEREQIRARGVNRKQRVKITLHLKEQPSMPQDQELNKKPFKCS